MLEQCALLFNLLFKGHFIVCVSGVHRAKIFLEHVALGKHVSVLAVVTPVGANPVEPIKLAFDGGNKVVAGNDGVLRHLPYFGAWVLVDVDVRGFGLGN